MSAVLLLVGPFRAVATASNCGIRPPRAAPVALPASQTCSRRRRLRPERSSEALESTVPSNLSGNLATVPPASAVAVWAMWP
jgi:hypothetical protein